MQKPKIGAAKASKACLNKVFAGALFALIRFGQFLIQPKQKPFSVFMSLLSA
jgi:hypothetical protein